MELGQRIRQVRIEKGLSQRQLCGDVITRNMLSQIENGTARPSIDTLSYLSARLGKPIGFFLEEDSVSLPNLRVMEQARSLFAEKNWPQLLSQLQQYREQDGGFDEERWLLQALCLMALAEKTEEKTYALQLLNEAAEAGKRTPYYTEDLGRRRLLQLAALLPTAELPCDDRALMLRADKMLQKGRPDLAAALLDSCDVCSGARWHSLRGEAAYAQAQYRDAITHFTRAEEYDPEHCYQRLEECYRALEDYKMAYEYACKRRNYL